MKSDSSIEKGKWEWEITAALYTGRLDLSICYKLSKSIFTLFFFAHSELVRWGAASSYSNLDGNLNLNS